MQFRVLGSLEVRRGDDLVDIGRSNERKILAALLVDVNAVVSTARLIEVVWGDETVVDAAWGLAFAVLAVAGGVSRTAGNRGTIPFGLVGGVAFMLASGTIAFTDTFDPLFKVRSLLSIWAILVGAIAIRRRSAASWESRRHTAVSTR